MKSKRVSPEDDKSIDWVLMDDKMLKEWYDAKMAKRAKRKKVLTFNNGYGMIVNSRKKT